MRRLLLARRVAGGEGFDALCLRSGETAEP